jgi:hypothetical protein
MNDGKKKKVVHEAFRDACLSKSPRTGPATFYTDPDLYAKLKELLSAAGLDEQAVSICLAKYCPDTLCRGCAKPLMADTFAIWTTYWWGFHMPCHKGCRDQGMKDEAYECQLIDADCNDCRHFKRHSGNQGTCLKFDKQTSAHAVFCSGYPCFEHRKTRTNEAGRRL